MLLCLTKEFHEIDCFSWHIHQASNRMGRSLNFLLDPDLFGVAGQTTVTMRRSSRKFRIECKRNIELDANDPEGRFGHFSI